MLAGIGAPDDATNTDTLWAWSSAEGGLGHNNPLNTTYPMANATPWNTLSNGFHVWVYATIEDGINATVYTLLNGRYPTIVSHLRNSIPRQQWGDACGELGVWGTGCGWINTFYGPAPGQEANDLTPQEDQWLAEVHAAVGRLELALGTATGPGQLNPNPPNYLGFINNEVRTALTEIAKISAATGVDLSPVTARLDALSKHLGVGVA